VAQDPKSVQIEYVSFRQEAQAGSFFTNKENRCPAQPAQPGSPSSQEEVVQPAFVSGSEENPARKNKWGQFVDFKRPQNLEAQGLTPGVKCSLSWNLKCRRIQKTVQVVQSVSSLMHASPCRPRAEAFCRQWRKAVPDICEALAEAMSAYYANGRSPRKMQKVWKKMVGRGVPCWSLLSRSPCLR
jgi:hypothetical protein